MKAEKDRRKKRVEATEAGLTLFLCDLDRHTYDQTRSMLEAYNAYPTNQLELRTRDEVVGELPGLINSALESLEEGEQCEITGQGKARQIRLLEVPSELR